MNTNMNQGASRRSLLLACLVIALLGQQAWAQQDVVSLSSPLTETVYLLAQEARLAAVADTSLFPDKAITDRKAGKMKIVDFSRPDFTVIDAIHPSLILTSTSFQRDLVTKLRAKGYRVLHFEPESIEDVFKQTEAIGEALGKSEQANAITRGWRTEVAEVAAKSAVLPRVKVYMEINHMGPWTSGGKSAENEIIRIAGGENIFADLDAGATTVTNQEILRRNPDIILSPIWLDAKVGGLDGITTLHEITSRAGYSETNAVRNSRVLYYDSALLKHQGPREVLAIRKLAYLLHPDVFENPTGTIPWELGRVRQ